MNLSALMTEFLMFGAVFSIACAPALMQHLRTRSGRSHGA
jgi:hypothetical protein